MSLFAICVTFLSLFQKKWHKIALHRGSKNAKKWLKIVENGRFLTKIDEISLKIEENYILCQK